ncbi:MAG TPA: hypothetical protein VK453_25185 [Micromonosporaceae bacterium]|nr:hypothetical protein [Micromonosporaceae bacterium]
MTAPMPVAPTHQPVRKGHCAVDGPKCVDTSAQLYARGWRCKACGPPAAPTPTTPTPSNVSPITKRRNPS